MPRTQPHPRTTPPTWITLTKITMRGEEQKVMIRCNSPIRIDEVVIPSQPLIHSIVRWVPQAHDDRDNEKPLFACETVEEIKNLMEGK